MGNETPQLLQGERLVWQGQPFAGLLVRPIEIVLIPFSLFWAGFAVFWNAEVWTANAPMPFQLFGLPFLAVGLYAVIGRFVVDQIIRRKTRYFVTSRRVLITKMIGNSVGRSISSDCRR